MKRRKPKRLKKPNFKEWITSLRFRIGCLFGCSMVLLFIIFSGIMYYQISTTVVPMVSEYSQEIVAMLADRISAVLNRQIAAVTAEAGNFLNGMMVDISTMSEKAREPYEDLLKETMERKGRSLPAEWVSLVFVDPLGTGYFSDGTRHKVLEEEYFQSVYADGSELYIGNPFIHPETGETVYIIASEVRNYNDERVGVLAATVRLTEVINLAVAAQIGKSGYGCIIDANGTVVAHPDPEVAFTLNLATCEELGYRGLMKVGEQLAQGLGGFEIVHSPDGDVEAVIFTPLDGTPGWGFSIHIPNTVLTDRINRIFSLLVWLVVIIVLIALGIVYYVSGTITRPITTIAAELDQVAQGVFTGNLPWKRKDEIGRIAASFNQMLERLRDAIETVRDITQQVSDASQQLSAVSEENSASIDEVASTTNEFASTAVAVSENARNMVASAEAVKEISDRGLRQVRVSSEAISAIASSSAASQEAMQNVQAAAERISGIVSLISDIAEQTNLLALNAAIEAARAGEHGRGFAVVADEVRSLSLETKKSVTEIENVVQELTSNVEHAVQVIQQTDEAVERGSRVLEKTHEGFSEIVQSINDVVGLITDVANAAASLEKGSQEIAAATEEQSASMEEIARSASALADMARRLEELMSSFKTA